MRILKFAIDQRVRLGLLHEDHAYDLSQRFPSIALLLAATMEGKGVLPGRMSQFPSWPLDQVRLLPPADDDARVFAIAQNYPAHAAEYGGPRPPAPVIFLKLTSSLASSDADVPLPAVSSFFDYEGELGVVIGRHGRDLSPDDALDYVAGYTICNDGSARDLLDITLAGKQIIDWFSAKNLDGASPIGPSIITSDEIQNPQNLLIQTRLNGDTVQDDRTSSMIFPIAEQIAFISHRVSLRPGDVIETGTPGGVGKARGRPLRAGDQLEVEIEGVGVLRNRFVPATNDHD